MKKIILVLLAGFCMKANGQEASVERSLTSVQAGILGLWIQNELRLTKTIALKTEIGFDVSNSGYIKDFSVNQHGFMAVPVLTLEPRFYFNLKRRASKLRNIEGNSGNFVSLNIMAHPDWFTLPANRRSATTTSIFATPMFGIKRSLGKHFYYEAAIGLGYGFVKDYDPGPYIRRRDYDAVFIIQTPVKIGYRF